jgi:hypothetical protein
MVPVHKIEGPETFLPLKWHVRLRSPAESIPGLLERFSYLAGMSPYISLKIKKRHYEHHMIEAHKYLITWISDDIFFKNSG